MAYVAVDKNGTECIFEKKPKRYKEAYAEIGEEILEENNVHWVELKADQSVDLPKGSIEKLIGKKLTWEDKPVELKEDNEQ